MDDWSPSSELIRIRKYLQAITVLLTVLVGLVGVAVYDGLGGPDTIGLLVLAFLAFVFVGIPGYAAYAAISIDSDHAEPESPAE